MRFNAFPFTLLPGFALAGYVIGQWPGVSSAVAVWCVVTTIGSLVHLASCRFEKRRLK